MAKRTKEQVTERMYCMHSPLAAYSQRKMAKKMMLMLTQKEKKKKRRKCTNLVSRHGGQSRREMRAEFLMRTAEFLSLCPALSAAAPAASPLLPHCRRHYSGERCTRHRCSLHLEVLYTSSFGGSPNFAPLLPNLLLLQLLLLCPQFLPPRHLC